jgi:hypothetical protein
VTIQAVSQAGDLLMLLTGAILLVIVSWAIVQLARQRTRSLIRLAGVLGGVVVLYGAAVVGAGLASGPRQLKPGDTKCFDDWCAGMVGARQDAVAGRLLVDVRLENRGLGRPMRSDLARAYVEVPGRGSVVPQDGHGLQAVLQPGGHVDVELAFDMASVTPGARFVVAEGVDTIGPGTFTIGDEVSSFHARAGWPLATS